MTQSVCVGVIVVMIMVMVVMMIVTMTVRVSGHAGLHLLDHLPRRPDGDLMLTRAAAKDNSQACFHRIVFPNAERISSHASSTVILL